MDVRLAATTALVLAGAGAALVPAPAQRLRTPRASRPASGRCGPPGLFVYPWC